MCLRFVAGKSPATFGIGAVNFVLVSLRCVFLLSFLCIIQLHSSSQGYALNVTVNEGDDHTLNCGNNINWTLIKNDGNRHLLNGSSYELRQINRTDAGLYKCCNSSGNCTTIQLIVYYCAKVNIIPSSITIHPGETFNLRCKVEGFPAKTEIYWYFKDALRSKENNANFTVANCCEEGDYICSPNNSLGTACNGTAKVEIKEPEPPKDLKAETMDCGIKISWIAPGNVNNCTVFYEVFFRRKDERNWTNLTGNTSDLSFTLTKEKLSVGVFKYQIRLKALVGSKESNFSNITEVEFNKLTTNGDTNSDYPLGVALGVALGVVLVVFLVVVAIGLIFRFRRRRCCLWAHCNGFFSVDNTASPPSPTKRPSIKMKRGPVSVDCFASHVKHLHTDGDYRFDQEFENLRGVHVRGRSWNHSDKPDNQLKNRYKDIIPYDHSRVILSLTDDDQESHYINANYVDSYNQINAYIATQGPVANTIGDFWRMVWEQNCSVVVMITNIIEKGRHKCAMYWPSKQAKSEVHGPLRVTHLDEEAFAHYTVRTFEVKPSDHSTHYTQLKYPRSRTVTIAMNLDLIDNEVEPMIVTQYHFTGWPDHGAPDVGCEYPALDFILRSAAANQDGAGPIVVHCSAGVGRSGAYIVIHSMVKRMHETGDLDVFDFLSHIRQQRNHLVQEECQYIFVHDALLHYIESDFKIAIPIGDLKDHVHRLRRHLTNPSSGKTKLEVEFEDLNAIQVKLYNLKQAKRACNSTKNRSMKFIPADRTRMELFPRPREEGSDYINASYLDGFWKSSAYIATQSPLENTIDDFWRMIWQENCRSIVMLVSKQELEQGYFPTYLPALYEMSRFNKYEVSVDSEVTRGDIVFREIRMVSTQDPSEVRKIRHFHFLHWPEDGTPWSGQTILQLIDKVDGWEKEVRANAKPFEMIGAMVVHCNYGVDRTGAYCLLHTMYHQIAREKTVSVYQIARLYNHQRPHCIQSQVQYDFCYDTLVEYIEAECSLYLV